MTEGAAWIRLDAALDVLIDLPESRRHAEVMRLAAGDAALLAQLTRLVAALGPEPSLLDTAASSFVKETQPESRAPGASLAEGSLLGAWRITGWIGAGGMGEVYRAERADGQFAQQVAIKLVRLDSRAAIERFERERQIVARLEHPGIARLLDGGVAPDGRPYMVMELVEGRSITSWCAEQQASLARRLRLFEQVCEAVAYAHRHLVVHCDIKPSNVLVGQEGRPRLLDFGVARWLDDDGTATRELLLTPSYAAPEQLVGLSATTATDVYALGLLLHELLTGVPVFDLRGMPLAAAMQRVIHGEPELPSKAARSATDQPVSPLLLAGDLDAILAKALRKEPEARYPSVDALLADLHRHARHEPVQARRGNWVYVAGRALRRHRSAAVAGGLAALALLSGAGLAVWQARAAEREARRANAVKSYLLQVFRASDPRVASDRPRGQITARELLDLGAARIDREFAAQPELQRELLGELASLYRELGEPERFAALQQQRLDLAQAAGDQAAVAEVWLNRAGAALDLPDRNQADLDLSQAKLALQRGHFGDSLLQARWWMTWGQAADPADVVRRREAFDEARRLYERLDPHDPGLVTTLIELGLLNYDKLDHEGAIALYRQAFKAYQTAHDRDDGEVQTLLGNLSHAELNLGRYDEAARASKQAMELARQTYGENHPNYWVPAAHYARLLHLQGQRVEARALLAPIMAELPQAWSADISEVIATQIDLLVAEGDGALAAVPARRLLAQSLMHPKTANAVRRTRLRLGEALWQMGQLSEARQLLRLAVDEYVAQEPAGAQTRLWAVGLMGRFLLAQGDLASAEPLLQQVSQADPARHLSHAALAQADLAALLLARGDVAGAQRLSEKAMADWRDVRGFRDVRMGLDIRLVRARILLGAGDRAGAHALASQALADAVSWDAASSPRAALARGLLALSLSKP